MINLRVLVPEATENYIQNPQFRYATTGWFTVGSTLTRSLDYARFGIASGKVVTNGAALGEGIYYRVNNLSGISDVVTVSVYLRGNTGDEKVLLRLQDDPTGFEWTTTVLELRTDRWIRAEITGRCTGGNDIRLKVETADSVARAYTFYVDGAQMERKPYSTSYCDGDQPGCRWNIVAHSSNSTRTTDTRQGGRWIPLAGPCRPNNDIYATVLGGLGMPPIQNNIQAWTTSPGSFFQNQKVLDRVITMNFTVKKRKMSVPNQVELSLRSLHELRQQLVDLFKTDKTINDEAFLFEYSDTTADRALYIRMRYDNGLDGSWDVRNGWFNSFTLRMISVDPFWIEDSYEVKQLTTKQSYSSAADMTIWGRINGQWNQLKTAAGITLTDYVKCMALAPDGTLYIGGGFTNSGLTRIVKWDGANFTVCGAGGANAVVTALAVGPDGTLYAVGDFTTIGGVAANRVAKYNPTTNTWAAMGTGLNARAEAVCVGPNGQIYVGGGFSTAGGTTMNGGITRWDGFQWRTVGTVIQTGNAINCIVNARDGVNLYIGGAFVSNGGDGSGAGSVGKIDTTTNLISNLGYGLNATVYDMAVGLDGTLYATGTFDTGGQYYFTGVADTPNRILKIAYWSGGLQWFQVGSGFATSFTSPAVQGYCLAIGKNGELYAGGNFIATGTKNLFKVGKFYGNTWTPLELNIQANKNNNLVYSIIPTSSGDLYIGTYAFGGAPYTAEVPKVNTITNPGTTVAYPIMYISGQGRLKYISNIKTGQEIFFDLTVYSGEDVFIDFAKGKIWSTVRGNLLYTLLSGSELRSMFLLPGDNQFSILVDNDVTATVQLGFTPVHWSADAVVKAQDLE